MSLDRTYRLSRILPSPVFDRLGSVVQQMAQVIEDQTLVLTEAILPSEDRPFNQVKRFFVVVSSQFSGLLVAETVPPEGNHSLEQKGRD